jgi:esterase/lipase
MPEGTWSGEYSITGDIHRTVEGTRQLVIEVRTVSSWLRKQVEKVVISGISLGGMMAHLAMAAEAFDAGITILAKHNKTRRLLMINGLYDEVMPGKFTMELWEALGRPKIKWYPCAHVTSILFVKNIAKDMVKFIHGDAEFNHV